MVVAKRRLPASSLKISTSKQVLPGKKFSPREKENDTENKVVDMQKPAEPDNLPFSKWNLPLQDERYIKCRDHDFL